MTMSTFVATTLPWVLLIIIALMIKKRKRASGPLIFAAFLAFVAGSMLADNATVRSIGKALVGAVMSIANMIGSLLR